MINFNIDVEKTLENIGIINYENAFIASDLCSGKGIKIEVVFNSGSTVEIRLNATDIVFFVDKKKIMIRAAEVFSIEPNIDTFNALVRAGEEYYYLT